MSTRHTISFPTLLLALVACGETVSSEHGQLEASVVEAECVGSAYDRSDVTADTGDTGHPVDPGLDVVVDGQDILVHLLGVTANCCPSPEADVDIDGADITIDFQSVTTDEMCNCMCLTDFTVEVTGVGPGSYTVSVDYDGAFFDSADVTVP